MSQGQDGELQSVWVDSWHQNPFWMQLSGPAVEGGPVVLDGSYDGGSWRIVIETGAGTLRLQMLNASASAGLDLYVVMEATLIRV